MEEFLYYFVYFYLDQIVYFYFIIIIHQQNNNQITFIKHTNLTINIFKQVGIEDDKIR